MRHCSLYLCMCAQAERLEELQDRLAVPYNGADPQHQQQLQELWALAFPHIPFTTLKSNQWKEMGWQVRVGQSANWHTHTHTHVLHATSSLTIGTHTCNTCNQ